MDMAQISAQPKTPLAITAIRFILALLFGAAGVAKLIGLAPLVAEFDAIGLGQSFRYLTGLIEVTGAVLLLWSPYAGFGALLVFGVSVGALLIQMFILHGDAIHTIVLASLAAILAFTQRRQIRAAMGM